ncbi:hypothetical protein BJ742DRAFT_822046 [Cladochytrium replicatum]|nr:hypothetical protein BJ742DRAFT_822046 [Cladochytrium replicatum]
MSMETRLNTLTVSNGVSKITKEDQTKRMVTKAAAAAAVAAQGAAKSPLHSRPSPAPSASVTAPAAAPPTTASPLMSTISFSDKPKRMGMKPPGRSTLSTSSMYHPSSASHHGHHSGAYGYGSNVSTKRISASAASDPSSYGDPTVKLDIGSLDDVVLQRYRRAYNLGPPPADAKAVEVSRDELVNAVSRHFDQQEVNEKDVLSYFIYSMRNREHVFKLPAPR